MAMTMHISDMGGMRVLYIISLWWILPYVYRAN